MLFVRSNAAPSRIIECPMNPRNREGTPDSDRYFWNIGTIVGVGFWSIVSIFSVIAFAKWLVAWAFG